MKAPATRFEDLVVWQKAHQFVLAAYRLTRTFPRSETYRLSSQQRRAAVLKRSASCWKLIRRPLWILTPDRCLPE